MTTAVDDVDVAIAMVKHGGSFVQALGRAWRFADVKNGVRLKDAFPEVWEKYRELVAMQKARESK